jgi:hypothetical protein
METRPFGNARESVFNSESVIRFREPGSALAVFESSSRPYIIKLPCDPVTAGLNTRCPALTHSTDFYRRLIIGCFTRSASQSLSLQQIQDVAGRIVEDSGVQELVRVLDELVADGTLAYGEQAGEYEIRRYH